MFHFITITDLGPLALFMCITLIIMTRFRLISKASRKVFLLDFACYKPPISQAVSLEKTMEIVKRNGNFTEETLQFMNKFIKNSGLGDSTYLPISLLKDPVDISFEAARKEAETVVLGAVDKVLAKTRVKCEDIGILIVNCSIFSGTPSLTSVLVNRYKLRDNIVSYNLTGMGCVASLSAISLAKQLLQVHHNTCALVVSTESLTQSFYRENDLSKVLVNLAFRLGGVAILLSNKLSVQCSSKYQLIHTIQNNTISSDLSYRSIFQEEDQEGNLGVTVTRDLLTAAVSTIRPHINKLGPMVLPVSEIILYVVKQYAMFVNLIESKPLVPDFKKGVDHFLTHVGGKPVLDALQTTLKFPDVYMEPSRMTLYRFGNTSSSSIWYQLAYVEAKKRIRKDDRVWQMAYGSGFEACSVVWRAVRTVDLEEMNPWSEEIDEFPVDLSKIEAPPGLFN